jgi:ubiquinone/menaquinone biosynthesis C-methylase UbiE
VWTDAGTVDGFKTAPPNPTLIDYARRLLGDRRPAHALDIGCGAGRNAVPLATLGWTVTGIDFSRPMLEGARTRAAGMALQVALATFERLPVRDACCDLVVAHGIWNLASSDDQFRTGLREAARVARPGARLFVATFRRQKLLLSGLAHYVVTDDQLRQELAAAGFDGDPDLPLRGSVILEGGFVRTPDRR